VRKLAHAIGVVMVLVISFAAEVYSLVAKWQVDLDNNAPSWARHATMGAALGFGIVFAFTVNWAVDCFNRDDDDEDEREDEGGTSQP
jgi:hypothetical protein